MTFHVLGIIIPTDELIFFRGVGIPPARIIYIYIRILHINYMTLVQCFSPFQLAWRFPIHEGTSLLGYPVDWTPPSKNSTYYILTIR